MQIARRGRDAHDLVQRRLPGIRLGGLSHMQHAPVAALEGRGGARDGAQRLADRRPAVMAAMGLHAGAQHAHRLTGQH